MDTDFNPRKKHKFAQDSYLKHKDLFPGSPDAQRAECVNTKTESRRDNGEYQTRQNDQALFITEGSL